MKRLIHLALVLAIFATSGFGVAATTTLNYKTGGSAVENVPTNFTINSTENIVIVQVSPGHPVTIEFNGTSAWYYRTTIGVSTNDKPIPAATAFKIRCTVTQTFYQVRQSADGTMNAMCLLQE